MYFKRIASRCALLFGLICKVDVS